MTVQREVEDIALSQIKDYDTVIFDCDGVIIDINNFKTEAFGKSIEEYSPEVVQGFVNYCKQTFGVSRYVKFKDFFEIFAKKPFNEEEYNIFLSRYAKLCEKGYMIAPFTPGCLKLLEKLNLLDKKLYVASGSDEKELVEIFKKRNNSFFKVNFNCFFPLKSFIYNNCSKVKMLLS